MIRPAIAADAEALSRLARDAYGHYVERIGAEPAPMAEDYATLIASGDVWVAEERGEPVGLLVLRAGLGHLLLENVAVSPAARGAGIGRQLLDFADARARERGLDEIRLCTNEAMTENLAYYPRMGYAETHRAVENGYHRVFFAKRL